MKFVTEGNTSIAGTPRIALWTRSRSLLASSSRCAMDSSSRAMRAATVSVSVLAGDLLDDGPARELRQPSVHRIRGVEEQGLAAVAAEDEEDLQQKLVAAVAEDQPVRLRAPARGENLAKLVAAAGVPVEKHTVQLLRRDVAAGDVRLGPFVRVDPDVGLEHLGAVRLELRELVPGARQLPIAHPSIA